MVVNAGVNRLHQDKTLHQPHGFLFLHCICEVSARKCCLQIHDGYDTSFLLPHCVALSKKRRYIGIAWTVFSSARPSVCLSTVQSRNLKLAISLPFLNSSSPNLHFILLLTTWTWWRQILKVTFSRTVPLLHLDLSERDTLNTHPVLVLIITLQMTHLFPIIRPVFKEANYTLIKLMRYIMLVIHMVPFIMLYNYGYISMVI